MLAARPDIRKALIARGWRTGVIAEVEMTMDIPEYSKMKRPGAPREEPVTQADRDYHANRSRGLGGNPTTGAEENLLGYPGTRYWGEHIFVHEFAHAIMTGLRTVDPDMAAEIRAAYDSAMSAGKYVHADGRKHYATTNAGEEGRRGPAVVLLELWRVLRRRGQSRDPGGIRRIRPGAERTDRACVHDSPNPDGRLPRGDVSAP